MYSCPKPSQAQSVSNSNNNMMISIYKRLCQMINSKVDSLTLSPFGMNLIFTSTNVGGTTINNILGTSGVPINPFILNNGGTTLTTPNVVYANEFEFSPSDGKAIYTGDYAGIVHVFGRVAMAEETSPINIYSIAVYVNNQIYPTNNAVITGRIEDATYSSCALIITAQVEVTKGDSIEVRIQKLETASGTNVKIDCIQVNITGQKIIQS